MVGGGKWVMLTFRLSGSASHCAATPPDLTARFGQHATLGVPLTNKPMSLLSALEFVTCLLKC